MPNYELGKIYKIEGNGLVYYGSTCEPTLSRRFAGHTRDFKTYNEQIVNQTVKKLKYMTSFQCLSDPNATITLVESCPCKTKDELAAREKHYIKNFPCVNRCVPLRTAKEYWEDNKEKFAEYQKQYYEKNKQALNQARNVYYNINKHICKKKKMCSDCVCVITNWCQHRNTQKHLNNCLRHQMIDEIALD